VVVGVGQYLEEQEWRAIASDPDNDYVFNITNFNFLGALRDSLPRRICLMPPIILGGECSVQENADLLFLSAPNGLNDALDALTDLAESFRSRDRLQVRYVLEACENDIDRGFQGPDIFCDRFGNALEQDDQTYVNLMTELRDSAREMRASRTANQVAVLFVDDQSLRANRFGILQEARNMASFDGIELIVVDLGVREYTNFINGMTQERDNVISYVGQTASESVRQILDRICLSANARPSDDFGDSRIS